MADHQFKEEVPQHAAAQPLIHKFSLEESRKKSEDALSAIIASSANKTPICDINIVDIENVPRKVRLTKTDFVGTFVNLRYGDKTTQNALRKGEDFVVLKLSTPPSGGELLSGPKAYNMTCGPVSALGITTELLTKISKEGYKAGELPLVEELLAKLAPKLAKRNINVLELSVGKPIDCIGLVNRSLAASGARKMDVLRPGSDVEAALGEPGMAKALTWSPAEISFEFKALSVMDTAPPDTTVRTRVENVEAAKKDMKAFMADAKPGDVVCFLELAVGVDNIAKGNALATSSGDRVIWLDGNNRLVNTSGMGPKARPGTPYIVGHTGVYAGTDSSTHEPLVAQSHVYTGTVENEVLRDYITTGGNWQGVVVLSHDFFVPKLAMRVEKAAGPE